MTKIAIVGEFWGDEELASGQPFAGSKLWLLKEMLANAGIDIAECHQTVVFQNRPTRMDVESYCGPKSTAIADYRPIRPAKYIRAEFQPHLDRLFDELAYVQPTLIIALGELPLWALAKKAGVKKYRGTPILAHGRPWKILPTWAPLTIIRNWSLRPICIADFTKARREAEFPDLRRPQRFIHVEPSLDDIAEFYQTYIKPVRDLSVDIETKGKQITEIGFAPSHERAIVIPFYSRAQRDGNYWRTLAEEREAWRWVRLILRHHSSFGQNFQYDMQYLWKTVGIPCPGFCDDTMLLHHSLQPEMDKGLGFLGSLYTDEPSWKFMRADHDTLKQADE